MTLHVLLDQMTAELGVDAGAILLRESGTYTCGPRQPGA